MIAARQWREGRERGGPGLDKLLCRNEDRWERGQDGEGGVRKGRTIQEGLMLSPIPALSWAGV